MMRAWLVLLFVTAANAPAQQPRFLLQRGESSERTPIDPAGLPALAQRLTLDLPNATRAEALRSIARVSGLRLVYANDLIPPGTVSIAGDTFTVHSALAAALRGTEVDVVVTAGGNAVLMRRVLVSQPLRLAGVVRDSSSSLPLAGAIVTTLDSARTPLASTIADSTGRFNLALADSARAVRIVRIGFQPVTAVLSATEQTVDIRMTRVVTLLRTVTVNDERLCSPDRDRAAALSLWEQARAGLLGTVVARSALAARATVFSYDRIIDLSEHTVVKQSSSTVSGLAFQPFATTVPPRVLAERGYVQREGEAKYFAVPDADVLLDDSFAATHCFSVRPGDARHPGAIGLAFEPARGRDAIVDVRGVLWMETGVPALRALEFSYAGPDSSVTHDGNEGELQFRLAPNGVSFVERWRVQLPVLESRGRPPIPPERVSFGASVRRLVQLASDPRVRLSHVSETGGVVLAASWPDGSTWVSAMQPLAGVVRERGSRAPVAGVLVSLAGTSDTVTTDSLGRFAFVAALEGRYVLHVTDTSLASFAAPRRTTRDVDIAADHAGELALDVPRRATALESACGHESSALVVAGQFPASTSHSVSIAASYASRPGDDDSPRRTRTTTTDANRRFWFCDMPRDRRIVLSATSAGTVLAQAVVMPGEGTVAVVEWHVPMTAGRTDP